MRIEIAAFGEAQLSREILRISDRAEDPIPVLDAIRDKFLESEKDLFDSQGASGGQPWAPLAPSTVDAKARDGLDPRILHATLSLRDSLTNAQDENFDYKADRDGSVMASNVIYGIYHQSSGPRHSLPRRPPVVITPDQRKEWLKMLQRFLITGEVE